MISKSQACTQFENGLALLLLFSLALIFAPLGLLYAILRSRPFWDACFAVIAACALLWISR
jgi:hypothetical protein